GLGSAPAVVSCYEAGYDGFWLHRLLRAAGIINHVFDPASIAVEQRARRAKTDRIDGELLLRTLMAHCRGEPRVVRVVRVPSAGQEDMRRDSRERQRLVQEQTAHINRIKALLRLLGMAVGNPRRRDWLSWLEAQRDWQGEPVPPRQMTELEREQGISKAGNPRARQAAIECAWLWLRHQPDSALSRWFRERTANASKRIRRIAIVALARKLMVALWRYLTTGLIPEGAVLSNA